MCWTEIIGAVAGSALSSKSSFAPSPPPHVAAPAPLAKDYTAAGDVTESVKKTRAKIAAASGYQSTIKTGAQGDTSAATTAKKTALGL